MSVFDEEPIQRNLKKTESWPVTLLMKYGIKSEQQATAIVIAISVVLIIITIIIYKDLFLPAEKMKPLDGLPPGMAEALNESYTNLESSKR